MNTGLKLVDTRRAANVTPYTVSRFIRQWERDGVLVKRRGEVLLLSPERLSSGVI